MWRVLQHLKSPSHTARVYCLPDEMDSYQMRKNIPTPKPGKSHRDAVRRLLRNARKASLATAMSNNGAPYASLVTIATDQDGSPILLLSGLADHTRNLATEPRASLLVEETEGLDNPQTGPRATIMGAIHRITDSQERERAKRRFLARHPSAANMLALAISLSIG